MKDWVDIHGWGELELVSILAYLLDYWEGAVALIVQLSRWPVGADIFGIQPDKVSSFVGRCRLSVSVHVFLLSILGKGHFAADQVMDVREAFCQTLGLTFFMVVYLDVRFKVNFGIQSVVRKEG
jgi:hypothetical protein